MTRLDKAMTALATMSPTQLQEKWVEVNPGPPPAVPTALLRRLLAQRYQEKRHGGLPLLVARELERFNAIGGALSAPARKSMALTSLPARINPSPASLPAKGAAAHG